MTPAQAVIYTSDMEPITVIDMKPWYWEFLYEHTMINLQIKHSPNPKWENDEDSICQQVNYVTVYADVIRKNNRVCMLLRASDEVTALLLDSSILPGQRRVFNEEKKKAFANGFLEAIKRRIGE